MNFKKKIITILILFFILIVGLATYDAVTTNKKYSINEKNIYIPIFVYHDIVSDSSKLQYDYMQTTKEKFEEQIKGLKKIGYDFITYEELKKFKKNEIKINKKSCLLTFDDGYEGVYENAYPIAKKYNIPFTMFIVTDNMEEDGIITWNQAEEMQNSGLVTIASHSINHPDFSRLSVQDALNNVNDSYKVIEEKLGNRPQKIFTYPYGLYTEEQINALEKEGYIQNLTDNKINKSNNIDLSKLHRCYPLNDSVFKMIIKIIYRGIRYN